ncbi:MAG: metalloregulator ArsR/SmtB family transcription factor [Methylovirgula sp.]|jgi:DNA-binding transcriptional ArsR family regulator
METIDAVTALAALAQESRLEVFRLLVQAGPDGMAAGEVASELGLAPNTLTFHFDRLRTAGLVSVERDGRSMIYAARFETMNALLAYLTENCCGGKACVPLAACKPTPARSKRTKIPA